MEKVIRASLDRIEGDFAIVYADDAATTTTTAGNDEYHSSSSNKFDIPLELVKGAKPGTRLQLHVENDHINYIEIDREATKGARNRIRKKYERLRRGRHLRQDNSI
ncbi:MAG TPA: DUF3006 domain-containing protein [Nitrososphaera sp.]|jgi:hypothetical protein|nr:DUF3006 domain-containing protein [Nitrososphaera sp.]